MPLLDKTACFVEQNPYDSLDSNKNELKQISGIRYCTMVAMVEGAGLDNNGYSTIEIQSEGTVLIHGFRKQQTREWEKA